MIVSVQPRSLILNWALSLNACVWEGGGGSFRFVRICTCLLKKLSDGRITKGRLMKANHDLISWDHDIHAH